MKLLCWMHRKFRQNSHEALKAIVIGQSSSVDDQYLGKARYGNRGLKQGGLRKSFTGIDTAAAEEEEYDEEPAISELFHGFLAIGTLGSSDQIPATPTFAISVDNITEKETEATENELKLINDELEKVLLDDESRVSNGRSSHGSVITLASKSEDSSGAVCPLQGYLFGSAIEMSETSPAIGRREHRTSLGELFQKTKMAEEDQNKDKDKDKDKDVSSMNLVKKIKLKKKMLHASSRNSSPSTPHSSSETKLHKILHMFHRKVHPETSVAMLKSGNKAPKIEQRKKTGHDGGNHEGQTGPDEDITLCPQRALFLKQKIRRYRSQSNPPHFSFSTIDCNGNREQWIKTDADYLVLEL